LRFHRTSTNDNGVIGECDWKPNKMTDLVIGASGLVGGYIAQHLASVDERPFALSRSLRTANDVQWYQGDLRQPNTLHFPQFDTIYCTASAILLAAALTALLRVPFRRLIAFSSTSVLTKFDSEIEAERVAGQRLAEAEETIANVCERAGVAWTILRPTLIYAEGRDTNLTPLSRLIRRFGFMPLVGGAHGLRQPVHAEDLAIGAINSASAPAAANQIYELPGGETLPYHEMIGRLFDALHRPRRMISIPPLVWRSAFPLTRSLFPGSNVAMGTRMMKDMVFDCAPAQRDFGWNPRAFHPKFD
jgi:nucleoside-diphosphate-sugar epimerase